MIRPMVTIHNVETSEIVEREMNDLEFAQYKIDNQQAISEQLNLEAKAAARQAILNRLGLTEDEAKLLLG